MKKVAAVLVCVLCMAGLTASVYADPPSHAKGQPTQNKQKNTSKPNKAVQSNKQKKGAQSIKPTNTSDALLHATITALAARNIAQQDGWTGYQPLPPGVAKNLARGKALPPGIAKKTVPGNMLHKLPAYTGYTWYVLGKDLVLISTASMIIADILHNVFD